MTRTLLLLSYWFPPTNAIGASRAVAIARFFADQGWSVTVVAAASNAVSSDFGIDLPGLNVHRVEDTALTRLINIRSGRKRWMRAFSALLRYVAFPDAFRSTTKVMGHVVDELIDKGANFDVILSTALPFSQHAVADRIARKTGALLVLDNRDTWACSDYRRRIPFLHTFERRYEHRVLSAGHIIITISDGMTTYFQTQYPDLARRVSTIRNGTDTFSSGYSDAGRINRQGLRLVYTGILYGARRDIRPLLEAAQTLTVPVTFEFFGSEPDRVAALKLAFPSLSIVDHGRVSRTRSLEVQRSADALIVCLGHGEAEKAFLPGKFFEYVGTGRPIIAIADDDSEISHLVRAYELGIASRDVGALRLFLSRLVVGDFVPLTKVPTPLTRDYQLGILHSRVLAALDDLRQHPLP